MIYLINQLTNKIHLELRFFRMKHIVTKGGWMSETPSPDVYNRLFIITEGSGLIRYNKKFVELKPGCTYVLPLNIEYVFSTDDFIEISFIHFNLNSGSKLDIFSRHREVIVQPSLPVANELVNNDFDKSVGSILRIKSKMYEVIGHFLSEEDIETIMHIESRYKDIFKFVEQNLSINIKISELANIIHLSESALTKAFKKDFNITLKNYLIQVVISKAIENLISTEKSIKQIAEELGFKSEFYFSNFFKKYMDTSPKIYRCKLRVK